jgi:hypothetical protein
VLIRLYIYIDNAEYIYRAVRIYSSVRYPLGRIYVVLSDDIERRLRLAIVKRLGGKKGDLSGAIEEAVNDWLGKDWSKFGDHGT